MTSSQSWTCRWRETQVCGIAGCSVTYMLNLEFHYIAHRRVWRAWLRARRWRWLSLRGRALRGRRLFRAIEIYGGLVPRYVYLSLSLFHLLWKCHLKICVTWCRSVSVSLEFFFSCLYVCASMFIRTSETIHFGGCALSLRTHRVCACVYVWLNVCVCWCLVCIYLGSCAWLLMCFVLCCVRLCEQLSSPYCRFRTKFNNDFTPHLWAILLLQRFNSLLLL